MTHAEAEEDPFNHRHRRHRARHVRPSTQPPGVGVGVGVLVGLGARLGRAADADKSAAAGERAWARAEAEPEPELLKPCPYLLCSPSARAHGRARVIARPSTGLPSCLRSLPPPHASPADPYADARARNTRGAAPIGRCGPGRLQRDHGQGPGASADA